MHFCGGAGAFTVALSFMDTNPWNQKSSSSKVLLAECCYETNITVLSLTFVIFRVGLIIPSLQSLIKIRNDNVGKVFSIVPFI